MAARIRNHRGHGVGGESIFGFRHWWNSRKLQTIQEAEERQREETIANLNKEAAQLRKDAGSEKTARLELQGNVAEAQNRVEELAGPTIRQPLTSN